MKFCYNTKFTLPKQSQRSRSLGLFWKEKTLSYNRRNTVLQNILTACFHFACMCTVKFLPNLMNTKCQKNKTIVKLFKLSKNHYSFANAESNYEHQKNLMLKFQVSIFDNFSIHYCTLVEYSLNIGASRCHKNA